MKSRKLQDGSSIIPKWKPKAQQKKLSAMFKKRPAKSRRSLGNRTFSIAGRIIRSEIYGIKRSEM